MAVREAAVNAILHGNAYNPAKNITATFEAGISDALDRAQYCRQKETGFDPTNVPDPTRRGKYPARLRARHLPHQSVHG